MVSCEITQADVIPPQQSQRAVPQPVSQAARAPDCDGCQSIRQGFATWVLLDGIVGLLGALLGHGEGHAGHHRG